MFNGFFNYRAMKEFSKYALTVNMESQVLAEKAAGTNPHLATTGGKSAMINGTFVASLAAQATIDLSSSTVCDCAGETVADGSDVWLLVLQKADGTPYVMKASNIEASAALKVPYYDPSIYVPIGLVNYINDSGSNYVIGTTNIDGDDCVIYQIFGMPLVPHSDNILKN